MLLMIVRMLLVLFMIVAIKVLIIFIGAMDNLKEQCHEKS